jgi:DNA polymerase-1
MLRIRDELAGDEIFFNAVQSKADLKEVAWFLNNNTALGWDTESTGINTYHPDWRLRTVQFGNATDAYLVPARFRSFIRWAMGRQIKWIAHNGPHDVRSIDCFLGYETGIVCDGETYIPSHHVDSRNRQEGGVGHGLKELALAHVDRTSDRWEKALKAKFKQIKVPVDGEVYKSGPRKGTQKYRNARLSEGWALIDPNHPAYIAYAAADPILAYRVWRYYQSTVRQFHDLYAFDKRVQQATDRLQRRAMRLDVEYTHKLSDAYRKRAQRYARMANEYGCANINSTAQLAEVLAGLGAKLTERTDKGKLKVDDQVMRGLLATGNAEVQQFIRAVLLAKQMNKRREAYTDAMLREMDSAGRVHPSINALAARTTRMSVSGPPLQQLPTKDRGDDE